MSSSDNNFIQNEMPKCEALVSDANHHPGLREAPPKWGKV